jgi:coenzyme F420 hydrogenase subunit beta
VKNKRFENVKQVVDSQLCMGCGACVYACPAKAIELVNIMDQGLRPVLNSDLCIDCDACLRVCPGIEISHESTNGETIPELRRAWGPVLEIWEAYATDYEIRLRGSSGGVVTALSLFCMERQGVEGVLEIGADPDVPWQNAVFFNRDRANLLACSSSRYSPAAPCEKLDWIEQAKACCVFVGKPCDVVALRKIQTQKPLFKDKVALVISLFCAGTPTSRGTQALLDVLKVRPDNVNELIYRGDGWPGDTSVRLKERDTEAYTMPYEESWGGILSNYTQFRCLLCPDSTGEFADISCGDPWYRTIKPSEVGRSLVLVRTERGRDVLHRAIQEGYIKAEQIVSENLALSQQSLLNKRRRLWSRIVAMRIGRMSTPCFRGFSLFTNWLDLSLPDKVRSILGSLYRVLVKGNAFLRCSS